MRAERFQYVPLLKAKLGEFQALKNLDRSAKKNTTPMLQAPMLDGYGDLEQAPASSAVDSTLQRLPGKIEAAWGTDQRFFLDLGFVDGDTRLAAGSHPLAYVFRQLRERGALGVPVTALDRDEAYQDAVSDIASDDERGACFRLQSEDLEDPEASVSSALRIIDSLDLSPSEIDLVLDLGVLTAAFGANVLAVDVTLRNIQHRDEWRSITVVGTGFPAVAEYGPDTENEARRLEWDLWKRVLRRDLPRAPAFGDYGIFGAQAPTAGPAPRFAPSPNLRYTTDDDWLILKARGPKHGNDQFNDLCAKLVNRSEYVGADFSWGDAYIQRCADGTDGPGNAAKWIEVGTNHHLTAVDYQLSKLAGL